MATSIEQYIPDLDKIAAHAADPTPLILDDQEYSEILSEYGLRRGTHLSDVGILRAMEAGLIKIGDPEGKFDLLQQIQACDIDLRLGHDFWHYDHRSRLPYITLGDHQQSIKDMIKYVCLAEGDSINILASDLILAVTQEWMSLSNVVKADFDGKSSMGRLGISNHQTATLFHPGYSGNLFMELSNTTNLTIRIPVHKAAVSMQFTLLDQPSSRARYFKNDGVLETRMQSSPFGFWEPEWISEKEKVMGDRLVLVGQNNGHIPRGLTGGTK